jgi:hypothetical protein
MNFQSRQCYLAVNIYELTGLVPHVQDMITAGMDTTVISVEWAMAELVRNPRV